MKTCLTVLLLLLTICHAARADLIKSLKFNLSSFFVSGDMSQAQTDSTPDSTTVRATLINNTMRSCWEFRLWNY